MSNAPQAKRPLNLDPLAVEMLNDLREHPEEARNVILGGYFALKHYLDYRSTRDIDAWWRQETSAREKSVTLECLRTIARSVAERNALVLKERITRDGEMVSLEFHHDGRARFSFQIADRSVELLPPLTDKSPWSPIPLEAFDDNIASKMNALVSRGAPRDFQDIRAVIFGGFLSISDTWDLWHAKNPQREIAEAKVQALRHLESIELRRPLHNVAEGERSHVAESRRWIREEFTTGHNDRTESRRR